MRTHRQLKPCSSKKNIIDIYQKKDTYLRPYLFMLLIYSIDQQLFSHVLVVELESIGCCIIG